MNQVNNPNMFNPSGYAGCAVMIGAGSQSQEPQPIRDKPLMDVEYEYLEKATLELDQSVQWLLQRIQPICQPCTGVKSVDGQSSQEPDAPESHMRTKLKNLRGLIESISSRISDVRYTIEI